MLLLKSPEIGNETILKEMVFLFLTLWFGGCGIYNKYKAITEHP